MSSPPTLTGPRVDLRAPQPRDADAIFAELASDPEVTRYLAWVPHADVTETRRVIAELFNADDDPTWVIELRDTGEVIGTCGWTTPRPYGVELGYCLGRRWWRQGIMTEVAQMLLDEAQRDPAVYRVAAYCHADNAGSAGVLRGCGLELEGRLARYAVFPNLGPDPKDCLMFAKAVR